MALIVRTEPHPTTDLSAAKSSFVQAPGPLTPANAVSSLLAVIGTAWLAGLQASRMRVRYPIPRSQARR